MIKKILMVFAISWVLGIILANFVWWLTHD